MHIIRRTFSLRTQVGCFLFFTCELNFTLAPRDPNKLEPNVGVKPWQVLAIAAVCAGRLAELLPESASDFKHNSLVPDSNSYFSGSKRVVT